MTKDEALEELDSLIIPRDGKQDKLADAFEMAIEALKQEPCEDCISRQAVLDTLENMDRALDEDRTVESYKELLRECYKVLPSVSSSEKLIVKKSRGLVKDLVKASPTETESEA